jgi:DNA-binding transcriptional ArsR family regulator
MHDQLSSTFAALADPTRRAILARLALGETSVTELAGPFKMSMPAVSKHLKVLERAGLISRGREAQWRPCRLDAAPLKEASFWIEEYRRFWSAHVDALERHLDRMDQDQMDQDRMNQDRMNPDRTDRQRSSTPPKTKTKKTTRSKPRTNKGEIK